MQKVLFIHRSVGQHILDRTHIRFDLRALNIDLVDVNANDLTIGNGRERAKCTWLHLGKGATAPDDFGQLFSEAMKDEALRDKLTDYDALVIKSCYTIWSAPLSEIGEYIHAYENQVAAFATAHPGLLFYLVTPPPPRRRHRSNRTEVIREFVRGMKQLAKIPNIEIIDFYCTLSDEHGRLAREYRRLLPFDQHPNLRGSESLASVMLDVLGHEDVHTP